MRRINQKAKKRLTNLARLIKNTRSMAVEMEDLNIEYAKDLDKILNEVHKLHVKSRSTEKQAENQVEKNHIVPSEFSSVEKHIREEMENATSPSTKPTNLIPPWAKELWREIVKIAHPDRFEKENLSVEEIYFRNKVFSQAMEANESKKWDELLYIGVLIKKYTTKLSPSRQFSKMGKLYEQDVNKINTIQQSLSWLWGTRWEDEEIRVSIVVELLKKMGKHVPSREEVLKILNELDS